MCELSVINIATTTDLLKLQRQQKLTVQSATADLIATAALLEKALDNNLSNEAHRLINAAYFQVNQVQQTFDQLAAQIDNLTLEEKK
ncbi:hypothetical protein DDM60_002655 [Vibrio cholerae]|uniref:Uncharacterized protein n=1 Tax=Vibrio cholerae TaxID=666 RepID=A0A7Z7YD50_VIBCL|nr:MULTISPECIES: hypothetical protein [Vibrio]EGQ9107540.1 hypothetical protein [Vibrio cholerae]EGR3853009.1 hypothetical protein [Vibrio cholerae]ELJ8564040.1 hypothetical protein [Vibrio cholerae]QIL87145.1 hypothetical protein G7083_14715 [Vibrio sp. HDW18]TBM39772.1 hypothetical protein EYB64_16160 [Vibrio cholerae]